jgi:2-polyprenyl-3-methyl-5-hydroxy-6-metoxy-1,4-benzoquinol methylase
VPCNLCGAEHAKVLSLKDRQAQYLRTVICRRCGLIWTDPRPTTEQVRAFYSSEYRHEYKHILRPKRKHILRYAVESVFRYGVLEGMLEKGAKVLDIGSGAGVFVYVLCQMGFDARGVEPDRCYAAYSAETLGIDITNAFFADATFEAQSLDAVLLHHVLEHMEDPWEALRKARDIVREGGLIVVGVPNAEDTRQAPYNRYHKAHLFTFNPLTLEAMGRKAGLAIHDRIVGSRNGNMVFTFRRQSGAEQRVTGLPGNYERITSILDRFNTPRYFATSAPYRTLVGKLVGSAGEKLALRGMGDEKQIIDSVIQRKMRSQSAELARQEARADVEIGAR